MKLRKLFLAICVSFLLGISSASAADRISQREIPTDLVQWLIKDINRNSPMDMENLEDLNKNLTCELYDLNGDGVPEYLLFINSHFWCGAGGFNCHYLAVQKTPKGYKLLLENTVIRVQDSGTNGYRDLTSELDSGCRGGIYAREIDVTVYRFDGKKYRAGRRYIGFRPFVQ